MHKGWEWMKKAGIGGVKKSGHQDIDNRRIDGYHNTKGVEPQNLDREECRKVVGYVEIQSAWALWSCMYVAAVCAACSYRATWPWCLACWAVGIVGCSLVWLGVA